MNEEEFSEHEALIAALMLKEAKSFRSFFLKLVKSMKSVENYETITSYLRIGRPDLVVQFVNQRTNEYLPALLSAFLAGASFETKQLLSLSARFNIPFAFDITQPVANAQLAEVQRIFIDEMRQSNIKLITDVINDHQNKSSPEVIARDVLTNYGLTSRSYQATKNYRESLEKLSMTSLDRELADDNYDEVILAAIAADRFLSTREIDRMVAAYRRNLIESRATQIANTSGRGTVEAGRSVAATLFDNALSLFGFETVKQWRSKRDDKVRFTHSHASLDGQVVPQGGYFQSISGARLRYPRDHSAPIKETINCRCNLLRYIRPKQLF